jgi:hypothetical protein
MKRPDETGIAGAVLHHARRKRSARRLAVTAAEVGAGPIRFNVALARAYGWTEEEIAEMVAHMTYIERDHAERCAERYPDRFGVADGRRVFTGEIPTTARGTP